MSAHHTETSFDVMTLGRVAHGNESEVHRLNRPVTLETNDPSKSVLSRLDSIIPSIETTFYRDWIQSNTFDVVEECSV